MKTLFLLAALLSFNVEANFQRYSSNARFPSQELFNKYVVKPGASTTSSVLSGHPMGASASVASSFLAQPDFARNLVITPAGTTNDIAAGNVIVSGWNANGKAITETFTFSANQSTAVVGNKAFGKIKSISFPAGDSPYGGTFNVGVGNKIGLPQCLDGAPWFYKGMVGSVALTGETLATSATDVESNTIITNPDADGSRVFTLLYIQNFRCR